MRSRPTSTLLIFAVSVVVHLGPTAASVAGVDDVAPAAIGADPKAPIQLDEASGSWVDVLATASRTHANTLATGVDAPAPEIVIVGDLIIPANLTLVHLHLTVYGDVTVQTGAGLLLYGTNLTVFGRYVIPVANLPSQVPPQVKQPFTKLQPTLLLQGTARFELHNLYAFRLPDGSPLPPVILDSPSSLYGRSGQIQGTVEGLNPTLKALLNQNVYPDSPGLLIIGQAGSRFRSEFSQIEGVANGYFYGNLTVDNTTVARSGRPLWGILAGDQSVVDSRFLRVDIGYVADQTLRSRFERNVVTGPGWFGGPSRGIQLATARDAVVSGNDISATYTAVYSASSTRAAVVNNVIHANGAGPTFSLDAGGLYAAGSSLLVKDNVFHNNSFGAVVSGSTNFTAWDNRFDDQIRAGAVVQASSIDLRRNTFDRNGRDTTYGVRGGLELSQVAATKFESNILRNNGFGVTLPYDSKGVLTVAQDTWVNGFNIDGTIDPAGRTYFMPGYGCDGRTEFVDFAREPSNGGTYTGAVNLEGLLTFYDCADILVERADLPRNTHGVLAWKTGSLEVRESTFTSNSVGYDRTIPLSNILFSGAVFSQDTTNLNVTGNLVTGAELGLYDRASGAGQIRGNTVKASVAGGGTKSAGIFTYASAATVADNVLERDQYGIVGWVVASNLTQNRINGSTHSGVLLVSAAARIDNTTITNSTDSGVYLLGSSPDIGESVVDGGTYGIVMIGSGPFIHDTTVRRTTYGIVPTTGGGGGVGPLSWSVCCSPSTPYLQRVHAQNNTYGVASSGSGVTVQASLLENTNNVHLTGGSFSVQDTTFRPRPGTTGGTGLDSQGASGDIQRSTFKNLGTAINANGGSITVGQSDVTFNTLGVNAMGSASLALNAIILQNNTGGGAQADSGAQLTVRDSNLGGNTAFGAKKLGTATVNMFNDWWGAAGGPNAPGADTTSGAVTIVGFRTSPNPGAGA